MEFFLKGILREVFLAAFIIGFYIMCVAQSSAKRNKK